MQFSSKFSLLAVMVVASMSPALGAGGLVGEGASIIGGIVTTILGEGTVVTGAVSTLLGEGVSVVEGEATTLLDGTKTTALVTFTPTATMTATDAVSTAMGTNTETTATATATDSAATSTPTSASDADFRVRVHHPKSNGGRFCRRWKADCINYRPHNKNLFFKSAYCVPGDYSGNFPHHVALVSCQ